MKSIYRIYPGIGVARVGNSSEYYIGPESPSLSVQGPFKHRGRIKKQGARFRIFKFNIDEKGNETVDKEVIPSKSVEIEWKVHLCNRKAASLRAPGESLIPRNPGYLPENLIIEGRKNISGVNNTGGKISGQIQFIGINGLEAEDEVTLGQLRTDEAGRLIVLGGNGISASPLGTLINSYSNNLGWYDDCCDGPVAASLHIDGRNIDVEKAWVVVAPPSYAPDIKNFVTWDDQMTNVITKTYSPALVLEPPSFTNDIYPILKRTVLLQWVSPTARAGHGPDAQRGGQFLDKKILLKLANNSETDKATRQKIFDRLMPPGTSAQGGQEIPNAGSGQSMPYLYSGVDPQDTRMGVFASLTQQQYNLMNKWANGDFHSDWKDELPEVEFDDIPIDEQPHALEKAALEGCIGGPFFPGIEVSHVMALSDTYEAPYRINRMLPAGSLTELLALPWQADFYSCGQLWWPSQRPVTVKRDSNFSDFMEGVQGQQDLVDKWSKLGFIVKDGNDYIEEERGSMS